MTPEQERTMHRLESRVDELTRRVQQLEAERLHAANAATLALAERNYRALTLDHEKPGADLGVKP